MSQRNYLNFTTPHGVELTGIAKSGLSSFLIHESGYMHRLTGWNHKGVDSPFWRFYHNTSPGCAVRFNGELLPLTPDIIVLIPAYTVFDCCGSEPASHFWIHFTLTRHSRVLLNSPTIITVNETLRSVLAQGIQLHGEDRSELLTQQIYHTSAALLHLGFGNIESLLEPCLPSAVADLLALIHSAPHSDLSNVFLAERSGMSLEKFIRWFRENVGETPAAYVAKARIKLASEALALTDKSLEQIAVEFGFPNRFYFSRVFAHELGCGPAEFRKRQRDKKGL